MPCRAFFSRMAPFLRRLISNFIFSVLFRREYFPPGLLYCLFSLIFLRLLELVAHGNHSDATNYRLTNISLARFTSGSSPRDHYAAVPNAGLPYEPPKFQAFNRGEESCVTRGKFVKLLGPRGVLHHPSVVKTAQQQGGFAMKITASFGTARNCRRA